MKTKEIAEKYKINPQDFDNFLKNSPEYNSRIVVTDEGIILDSSIDIEAAVADFKSSFMSDETTYIKCSACGEFIVAGGKFCPNCGNKITSNFSSRTETELEKDSGNPQNEEIENPVPTAETSEDVISPEAADELPGSNKPEKKKHKKLIFVILIIIILLIVIILAASGSKNSKLQTLETEAAEIKEYNRYVDYLNAIYGDSYSAAADAEDVCVLTANVWYDAIYGDSDEDTEQYVEGADDFNEAIQNVYADEDVQETLDEIEEKQETLAYYIQALQDCPEELSSAYSAALETYTTFNDLAEFALSPSGNYTTYIESESDKIDDYVSALTILGALIPEKKEVPLYDSNGDQIEDELSFFLYLNQDSDLLPDTVTLNGYYAVDSEPVTICGVEGTVTYLVSSSGIVNPLMWEVENPDDGLVQDMVDLINERYGEGTETDGSYYWSNKSNDGNYSISISEKDDGNLVMFVYLILETD